MKHSIVSWSGIAGLCMAFGLAAAAVPTLAVAQNLDAASVAAYDGDEAAPEFAQRVAYAEAEQAAATEAAPPVAGGCGTSCGSTCGNSFGSCCGTSCGGTCGDSCGGCGGCGGCGCKSPLFQNCGSRQPIFSQGKFLRLFQGTDDAFNGFVSPATNVLLFEDPRTLSEVRLHFVNQQLGSNAVTPAGGNAQLVAGQIRAAITDRLSFIAMSDGYLWINPKGGANASGMNNWSAGLKYNIVRNPARQFVWSAAATVYIPVNKPDVFMFPTSQLHFFTTAGKKLEFMPLNSHVLTGGGIRVPTAAGYNTMMWTSVQFDAEVIHHIYGIFGFNSFYYLNNGSNLPGVGFGGADLFNLGSAASGQTQAYLSVGTRYKPGRNEYGVAFEFPVTSQQGIQQNRLYVDACLRF